MMKSPNEKISVLQNGYGLSIEYTLDPDEKLNTFINGMMTHNNIKGVLGYIYEANNGARKLRFNHPDGIRLSMLLTQTLRKRTLLGILSSIADAVCRVEEYMLAESGFVFEPQLIFVNSTTLDTNLIYIPTGICSDQTFCAFVKNIIYSSAVSTDEDTTYVQQIANRINLDTNISNSELGKFIKSLAAESPSASTNAQAAAEQHISVSPNRPAQSIVNTSSANRQPNIPPIPGVEEPKDKKSGFFSGFGGKKKSKKTEKPAKEAQNSGFGFSIPGQMPVSKPSNSGGFGFNIPGQNPVPAQPSINNSSFLPPPSPPQTQQQPAYAAASNNAAQPAAEIEDDFQDGKTVLLGVGGSDGTHKQQVFLEKKNGERIYITKTNFFIGQADKADIANDYIVKNSAVSRNHAYLQLTAGGATITDNNSLNGTFINGEKIPSSVNWALKNGDIVRLANEEFVFRIV